MISGIWQIAYTYIEISSVSCQFGPNVVRLKQVIESPSCMMASVTTVDRTPDILQQVKGGHLSMDKCDGGDEQTQTQHHSGKMNYKSHSLFVFLIN